MPSTSKKQHNFMEAIAHNPAFAKKVGVPQSVGQDFATADKGKKFKESGMKKMANGGITKEKMGSVKTAAPSRDGIASKGKTKGTMVKMSGSTPLGMKKGGMTKKMNMGGKAC
jgi:hypothetical protein